MQMKKRMFLLIEALCTILLLYAEDWHTVTTSGLYYYGEGTGATDKEAEGKALENLLQMIAMDTQRDFHSIDSEQRLEGQMSLEKRVYQCLQTYASVADKCVQTMLVRQTPNAIVRKWMKRSELDKLYEERFGRLKNMVTQADAALERGNVDVALQYYYWAYSLVRSLQFPDKVTDAKRNVLMNTLPATIKEVLQHIRVQYVGREENGVDLRFIYKGKPVSVDFTYDDGQHRNCDGRADGGNAYIEMQPGYDASAGYRLRVEYEYKNWARGDAEMRSVLAVVPRSSFANVFTIKGKVSKPTQQQTSELKVKEAPTNDSLIANAAKYAERINAIIEALRLQQWDRAYSFLSARGLKVNNFVRLVSQRNGRILGTPTLTLYQGANGTVLVRGVQMAFSVTERGKKTTLVDDVVFTFDKDLKISNLTFGIGTVAQNDLLCKNVSWGEETRQMVMDFLENYKTAYCLKDYDYIEGVFDDNATIIVGNVVKRTTRPGIPENQMSDLGKEIIKYKRYTKSEYLANLKRTFDRNQFVNIKFTNNDVNMLENELPRQVFEIQIAQEYTSSTYADQGYLFLLVDMTNHEAPVIKIRAWQPKPDPEFGLFTSGHFYK